jgi:hypothetical protein
LHIHTRFGALTKRGSLALKIEFVDIAFNFFEKYFPDWQNNKYYIERRNAKLSSRRAHAYCYARESRFGLKKYYFIRFIKRYLVKKVKKMKKALKIR